MARKRYIKPGLFKNEVLGEADPLHTLLFAGLWVLADKEGRLECRPKKIKAEIFPYRFDYDPSMGLDWLKHESFINLYKVDDKEYIQINNWRRHQTPHHKEVGSEIPPEPEHGESQEEDDKPEEKQSLSHACANHESSTGQEKPLLPHLDFNLDSNLDLNNKKPSASGFVNPDGTSPTGQNADLLVDNLADHDHENDPPPEKPHGLASLANVYIEQGEQLRFIKAMSARYSEGIIHDTMSDALGRLCIQADNQPLLADNAIGYCTGALNNLAN